MHMLHHVSLGVANIKRSSDLYDAMLAPLGYGRVWSDLRPGEQGQAVGYGVAGSGDKLALKQISGAISIGEGFHLAFAASGHDAVRAFHEAALRNGAKNNGQPGYRAHYGAHYYAAFVIDLDGHHLEAVCNSQVE